MAVVTHHGWLQPAEALPRQSRQCVILQSIHLATALILTPVLVAISMHLPVDLAWENGPLETAQNLLIAAAAVVCVAMVWRSRERAVRCLWLAATLIWLLLGGRELSWGGVLMPPISFDPGLGPFYSSRILPYKSFIPAAFVLLCVLAVLLFLCASPARLMRCAWQRRTLAPWGMLLASLLFGLISVFAERRGTTLPANAQAIEEVFETGAYYYLLRAQIWGIRYWLRSSRGVQEHESVQKKE